MKIAIVTCADMLNYNSSVGSEDELIHEYLSDRGLDLTFAIWDSPSVVWKNYDLLLIKSPWDYFDKIAAFYSWLKNMKSEGIPMLNSTEIIYWNADKIYLKEMQESEISIVPTLWLNKGSKFQPAALFDQLKCNKLIVKPRISGGAKQTFSIERTDQAVWEKVYPLVDESNFMVQPFLEGIVTEGEYSLIFFNGKFSHCVLKKAKKDDFRVQHFLGGTIHPMEPPASILKQAQHVIDLFAADCMYARVDGVQVAGVLQLMELELIEPFLFLFSHKNGVKNYYNALQEAIQNLDHSNGS